MDAKIGVMSGKGVDIGTPASWQKEIDLRSAVEGMSSSPLLKRCDQLKEVIGLEGVDGATPLLQKLAKSGFVKSENMVRAGNGKRGEPKAIGIRLTYLPGLEGNQVMLANETGVWIQVGSAKGAVPIDENTAFEHVRKEVEWRAQMESGQV